ncbi:translation initiation factor IF-2 subunit beta [Candidatus Woesearchaeota archaeon CG10_big_fil_rev_8_21_14_0_10_30_7]|nr:MAG: translation initiation factor IF-2 subunit beta [Candidatus Woesearchaeota archaeon CG10_big_fil_rev_8_21_14_0_10_30_7]
MSALISILMNYNNLLKRAQDNMPAIVHEIERFEVPKIRGHLEGNKTVISNFQQVAQILRRPIDHLLKFLLKQLATPGEIKRSGLLILGAKISASRINQKIKEYAIVYVLCAQCGKPDTEIKKENNINMMKCLACGAKNSVKA